MSDSIKQLILQTVPSDGSTIGNGRLLDTLRITAPMITDQDYWATRDDLIDQGVLGKGRGRDGAVYLISANASGGRTEQSTQMKQSPDRTPSHQGQQPDLWSFG